MLFPNLSTVIMAATAFTSTVTAWPSYPQQTNGVSKLGAKMPHETLPDPPAGLELKYVLLGVGTQNYTCIGGNASSVPGTTGAVATLYDLGTRLSNDPLAQYKIPVISGLALSLSQYGTWQMDMYLKAEGYATQLGNHFFTAATPTFSLWKVKKTPYPIAMVSKKATADAPKTACQGTKGEGAVPWLYLADDAGLSQGGVNTVYRIETAGGNKPTTCNGMPDHFEVPYAAQYWVWGPSS